MWELFTSFFVHGWSLYTPHHGVENANTVSVNGLVTYLRNATGTIPALYWAIWRKAGSAISKCCRGGLHQPPSLFGKAKFGGQKFVAVTTMVPGLHHLGSSSHLISKHAPQLKPLSNNAVLRAAVLVPYPWLYKFPYPHAPPARIKQQGQKLQNKIKTMSKLCLLKVSDSECVLHEVVLNTE